jgi:hypothetical protein
MGKLRSMLYQSRSHCPLDYWSQTRLRPIGFFQYSCATRRLLLDGPHLTVFGMVKRATLLAGRPRPA